MLADQPLLGVMASVYRIDATVEHIHELIRSMLTDTCRREVRIGQLILKINDYKYIYFKHSFVNL